MRINPLQPETLSPEIRYVHDVSRALITGHILPDPTYKQAVYLLGRDGVAELFFLVGGYSLIAMILNGFDIPAPQNTA